MEIKVKDDVTGIVYSSNMSDENKNSILAMNFCTSYTQVNVQQEIDGKFPTHNIIVPPLGSAPSWVDGIATQGDHTGQFIN